MILLNEAKESECSCDHCQSMCTRPCWPTPKEAHILIEKGYGASLMLDYWYGHSENIEVLCPALKGSEGKKAPRYPRSDEGCTFWGVDKLCALHSIKLKPLEGRTAHHEIEEDQDKDPSIHEQIARLWDTDEGRNVVSNWKLVFMKRGEEEETPDNGSFIEDLKKLKDRFSELRKNVEKSLFQENEAVSHKEVIARIMQYLMKQDHEAVCRLAANCMIDLNRALNRELLDQEQKDFFEYRLRHNFDQIMHLMTTPPEKDVPLTFIKKDDDEHK
jgi:hypothetical protein